MPKLKISASKRSVISDGISFYAEARTAEAARVIVHAVNCHDAMVDACDKIAGWHEHAMGCPKSEITEPTGVVECDCGLDAVRLALRTAGANP